MKHTEERLTICPECLGDGILYDLSDDAVPCEHCNSSGMLWAELDPPNLDDAIVLAELARELVAPHGEIDAVALEYAVAHTGLGSFTLEANAARAQEVNQ